MGIACPESLVSCPGAGSCPRRTPSGSPGNSKMWMRTQSAGNILIWAEMKKGVMWWSPSEAGSGVSLWWWTRKCVPACIFEKYYYALISRNKENPLLPKYLIKLIQLLPLCFVHFQGSRHTWKMIWMVNQNQTQFKSERWWIEEKKTFRNRSRPSLRLFLLYPVREMYYTQI